MTKEEFINALKNLNIILTPTQITQLEIYKEFLKEYNSHTNLTAIKEENAIYLKHFYDSLTIVKAINLNNIDTLLDIGTGAGFPGMVLKIVFPKLKVTLLDSNNKKTKFLNELAQKLNIDVEIINERCEIYAKNNLNKFALVTSRAVANLRVLAEISLPLVKVDGLFIALKGALDDSLEDSIPTINIFHASIIKHITFDLPHKAGIRNIVVIQKNQPTILSNLRSYDKIIKKPLQKSFK